MNLHLNELHLVILQVGALVCTVLFIIRVCLNEIRNMKRRK
jgi:hypothetical protein